MVTKKYKQLLNEVEQDRKNSENLHRDSKVLLVDSLNLFIRCFSAIPTLNSDGAHVGGMVGFLKSLGMIIRMIKPTRVVLVFDGKGGSQRRKKLYQNYKERKAIKSRLNRVVGFEDITDEQTSMKFQMSRLYQYLQLLPVTTVVIDNIEADDTISYLSSYFKEKVYILSNDRDFLQLVSDRVNVYVPTKKKMYTPQNLREEYGVWSGGNFAIYKALLGDTSDNIKGIRGMGKKTITKHFPQLGEEQEISLDDFINDCMKYDGNIKAMNELKNNINQFKINYEIMQLQEVDIPASTKSNIRGIVDGEISSMNKVQIEMISIQDKIRDLFTNFDVWLQENFKGLDSFRNTMK
jgi:DNA polymerase-1